MDPEERRARLERGGCLLALIAGLVAAGIARLLLTHAHEILVPITGVVTAVWVWRKVLEARDGN